MEPMRAVGMGGIPADKDFMKAIRELTQHNNVILLHSS